MLNWFRRKREAEKPVPLKGAPPHPRVKSYSAMTGYVYQYYFAGQREALRGGTPGIEYVFHISADRKTEWPVSVFLAHQVVSEWMEANGRDLRGSHRYAIAKMALRNALDERRVEEAFGEVRPEVDEVTVILGELDV